MTSVFPHIDNTHFLDSYDIRTMTSLNQWNQEISKSAYLNSVA